VVLGPVAVRVSGPGRRVGVLGGWGDGDVQSEGLELEEVGVNLAVAVGLAGVPACTEVAARAASISSSTAAACRSRR
jgi:hypothetical protein